MIANGMLTPITTTGGGFVNGRVVEASEVRGAAVPCNYRSNTSDLVRYYDGSGYKVAEFVVYVTGTTFMAEMVELVDKRGAQLGRYRIRNLERLHSVNRTKLTL